MKDKEFLGCDFIDVIYGALQRLPTKKVSNYPFVCCKDRGELIFTVRVGTTTREFSLRPADIAEMED